MRFQQCLTRGMTVIKMYLVSSIKSLGYDVYKQISSKVKWGIEVSYRDPSFVNVMDRPPISPSLLANKRHCCTSSFECYHPPWNLSALSSVNDVKAIKSKLQLGRDRGIYAKADPSPYMQVSSIVSRHFEFLFPNSAKSPGSCDITQDTRSRTLQWRLAWICKFIASHPLRLY